MKNQLFLITGVMASGKSTVAQLLAERLEKSVHLSAAPAVSFDGGDGPGIF